MKQLERFITPFIADQFPSIYKEEGPLFIAFLKAYFEWLESQNQVIYDSRRLLEYRDIDKTVDVFINEFKKKYMFPIPEDISGDKRLLQKHIKEVYGSKGTERGLKLLFQLLFGDTISVYKPGDDVFRLSDGEWNRDIYLEVSYKPLNSLFVGEFVRGRISGATAYVESFQTKFVNNKNVNIFYLTDVKGNFRYDEVVLIDESKLPTGTLPAVSAVNSPKIIGSLSEVVVEDRSSPFGYSIGEQLEVQGSGKRGKVVVTSLRELDGTVTFNLVDGGSGYTVNNTVFTLYGPVTGVVVEDGGSGYSNSDYLIFSNGTANGTANIITNNSGAILNLNPNTGAPGISVTHGGNGFLTANSANLLQYSVVINVANSTGGLSAGAGANLVATIAGGGTDAGLRIGELVDKKNIFTSVVKINTIGSNTTYLGTANNVDNMLIGTLSYPTGNGYGLQANVQAGFDTVLRDALGFQNYEVGTISKIITTNPGQDYTTNLTVTIVDTVISTLGALDTTHPAGRGAQGNGYLGNNAVVNAVAGFGTTALGSVKVIDSGLGYQQREEVTLVSLSNTSLITSGTAILSKQGQGEGYFSSTKGFLSSEMRIHDSYYYQDYSYEVRSSIVFAKYSDLLRKLWHPAGVEKFGRVLVSSEIPVSTPDVVTSTYLGDGDTTSFSIPGGA
ncbi:hypothetical protein OAU13_00965 [bacterium]|nr:hypothetical protein [bacterium]